MSRQGMLLLTGAPDVDSLDWREDGLHQRMLPCFYDFTVPVPRAPQSSALRSTWRSLSLQRRHLPSGLTQIGAKHNLDAASSPFERRPEDPQESPSFFTTSDLSFNSVITGSGNSKPRNASSTESEEETLSQFYEQSFAVHEDVVSSRVMPGPANAAARHEDSHDFEGTSSCSPSVESETTSAESPSIAQSRLLPLFNSPILAVGHPRAVSSIPSAAYLQSIQPHTMTVDLIVAVISVAPPRLIRTRRAGQEMEIVELLVGDETKAGFAINFWLLPEQQPQGMNQGRTAAGMGSLRASIDALRPQDVVLLKSVALSSFRARVYGQSLRKGLTKLHGLYRPAIHERDGQTQKRLLALDGGRAGGAHVAKIERIKEWATLFVMPAAVPHGTSTCNAPYNYAANEYAGGPLGREELPPDTQ